MKAKLFLTTALTVLLQPGITQAQTASPTPANTGTDLPTSAGPPPADANGLQDIVVTAQRRSENLQRVPIAIDVASGTELAARGIVSTTQLAIVSPGLNINETAGSFQPSLRGIGTSSTVSENPVALFIDGVYIPQQRDGVRELEDIEQIAVLKGPQGTLFGRNATAGVIQITTKAPSFYFGGEVHAGLDDYLTARVGGYVTGALSSNVAASLSANVVAQGNGYGRNYTTGSDTYQVLHDASVRGKLLFRLGDTTEATLAGDYSDSKRLTAHLIPVPGTQLGFPNPYTTTPLTSVYDTYEGAGGYTAVHGGGVSLTVSHETGSIKLVSIIAYRDITSNYQFDAIPVPQQLQVVQSTDSPSRSFSQEFQLLSNQHGRFDWTAGLYYFNYDNGATPITRDLGGFLISPVTHVAQTLTYAIENTEAVAPFGQFTWEFLPDTHLTGGARYTYERRKLTDARVLAIDTTGATVSTTNYGGRTDFSDPTFRAALDHRFSNAILVYASFNTGFKSGGFNSVSPATAPYKPEKLKAYEAGIKSELFDRKLRLNAAGFYYDYTNLQVIQFVNTIQTVTNGPKAELYGLDVDFEARPIDAFRLSGGFEVLHSRFVSYPGAIFGVLGPAGVGAKLVPGDATGNRLPQAQNFSGTLAGDYHYALPAGSLDFNVTANYNGDFYFQADNAVRQAPYTIVNTSAAWTLPGERVSLKIWGRNLADARPKTAVIETAVGFEAVFTDAPRTFGGTVAYKF